MGGSSSRVTLQSAARFLQINNVNGAKFCTSVLLLVLYDFH